MILSDRDVLAFRDTIFQFLVDIFDRETQFILRE